LRKEPTQPDLVHDSDAGILALLVKLQHSRRNVARGDDMLLLTDGRLDDGSVEGVGNQADNKVVLRQLGVQGLVVGNIERDGGGILNTGRESFGRFKSSASCEGVSGWMGEHHSAEGHRPTVTGIPESERTSRVGLVTKPAPSINTLRKVNREPQSPLNARLAGCALLLGCHVECVKLVAWIGGEYP
jgi:hypothetical protein